MLQWKRTLLNLVLLATGVSAATPASAGPIQSVAYESIGPNIVDFEDVAAVPFPGTVYDTVLESGGCTFGTGFVGQALQNNGDLDVLAGEPTSPLTLLLGLRGQNLAVGHDTEDHELFPYGVPAYPQPHGYGEGSFSVIFPGPVAQFGIRTTFGEAWSSTTTFQFFRADGSLISAVTVEGTGLFGFATDDGAKDIHGVSVHTSDPGGLGYDDLVFSEPDPSDLQRTPDGQFRYLNW